MKAGGTAATILELFENRVNESSARPALRRVVEEEWQALTWREWFHASERVAAGLVTLGVEPGDRVALLSETRAEWLICDVAIMMAGAVTVPVYPSLSADLTHQILQDSGARVAIAGDPSQLDKIVEGAASLDALQHVAWIDAQRAGRRPDHKGRIDVRIEDVLDDVDPWNVSLEDVAAAGRRALTTDALLVAHRRREVEPTDLATIVYTSGTTGEPRGVALTHANLVAQVDTLTRLDLLRADDVHYMFLPLAHIFARVLSLAGIGYGFETVVSEDLGNLVAEMRACRPTFFAGVPQIFEQIRSKLEADAGRSSMRSRIFKAAEEVGRRAERARDGRAPTAFDRARRKLLDELTPGRVQAMFGGNVRFAISGGASLSPDTAELFAAFGLDVLEGYGLTETSAVCTVNLPDDFRFGSVGRPLPGVTMTIDEDGEILVRAPTVTAGYWKRDGSLESATRADGWFATGDLGRFDRDGFLFITGRKKEILVTAGGKNIAPAPLEAALQSIAFVSRAVVFGDDRPYLVALLSLDQGVLRDWGKMHDIDDPAESVEFREELGAAIRDLNARNPGFTEVRRWEVVQDDFTEEAGEVTATGKIRRSVVAETRRALLDALYDP